MQERVESRGFFEMLWDCGYCDSKGLLGKSQRYCPNCGAKQDPDKRYFPPDGQAVRVDGHKYAGADRYCPACNAPQSAAANNCAHCGAPLDGAAEVKGVVSPVAPKPRPKRWRLVAVLGAIALVIIAIWYAFFRTKETQLTVTAHRWERAIAIEEFRDRSESAWRDEVPYDARMVSCHRAERSSKQVPDGEECRLERVDRKDGTFEEIQKCRTRYRSEPIYDDRCSYMVRRWQEVDSVRLTGEGLVPAWPSHAPPPTAAELVGSRRAGRRREQLILEFGDQRCEVSEAVWKKYTDGRRYKVAVRARSGAVVCGKL
ncbi:MAG TPA: hypothetical protein VK427_16620 [Kofleriaceae bacterium]|nr:hypothetical protein [Kofleriaceae bacterium]